MVVVVKVGIRPGNPVQQDVAAAYWLLATVAPSSNCPGVHQGVTGWSFCRGYWCIASQPPCVRPLTPAAPG